MTAEDAAIYKEMLKDCEDNGKTTIDDLKAVSYTHLLCVCYGLLCNAGIVADFALSQMIAKNV